MCVPTTESSEPYSLSQYEVDVLTTRRDPPSAEWQDEYYEFIQGEYGELIGQHGPVLTMFLRRANQEELVKENPDILEGLKEELGDLLWFDVSAAELLGQDPAKLCSDALKAHTGKKYTLTSFGELQKTVSNNAHLITVLTKWGIYHPEAPDEQKRTSFLESPFYVFNRFNFRLTRALSKEKFDTIPLTASQMEPISTLELALGGHINALAYIAHLAGIDMDDVARSNIEKLRHRAIHGKKSEAEN
jgi:NTP pyrophosphatase (non-canonical NTP hydrolase)